MRKLIATAAVSGALLFSLTACAEERHATLDDCVSYYLVQDYTDGATVDTLTETCIKIFEKEGEESFDSKFLPGD